MIVFFDAVGTLFDAHPPVAEVYWQHGRRHGSNLELAEIQQRFRTAFKETFRVASQSSTLSDSQQPDADWTSDDQTERRRWRQVVQQVFHDVEPIEPLFNQLWEYFADSASWRLYADVPPAWDSIRQAGWRIGIASNFDARLQSVVEGMPELASADWVFACSQLGYLKPDPRFFETIQREVNAGADRLVSVGDHRQVDLEPAGKLGWRTVWLRRDQPTGGVGWIASLNDLAEVLASES